MLIAFWLSRAALSVPVKRPQHKTGYAALALLALLIFAVSGCGKRKPPLPPSERVQQRVEIAGFQRGDQIVLSWKMPARNASKGSVLNISRADIYRLAEPLNSPPAISEEEFASRSILVGTLPIDDDDFALSTLTYRDPLQFAGQPVRLRYAVRFVNAQGQKAGFSNFLLLEPASRIAAAPTSLSATPSQDAITLTWTAPLSNVDGTTPPNIVGYNIYRSVSLREVAKLLNEAPVSETEFRDRFFEFDKPFFYFVRTVSVGSGGEPVESGESNIVEIRAKDVFAPSPPAALTLAATPTTISIFFAVNPENDVAGYRIYRSLEEDKPLDEWELQTPELSPTNTFQDNRVEPGKRYFYYIRAIDKTGNVSEPSEVVSEVVPQ